MKVDRNFNKRSAELIDVQGPLVSAGRGDAMGIAVTLIPSEAQDRRMDVGVLRAHLTPNEAIAFGLNLISAARDRLAQVGKLE